MIQRWFTLWLWSKLLKFDNAECKFITFTVLMLDWTYSLVSTVGHRLKVFTLILAASGNHPKSPTHNRGSAPRRRWVVLGGHVVGSHNTRDVLNCCRLVHVSWFGQEVSVVHFVGVAPISPSSSSATAPSPAASLTWPACAVLVNCT